jgi:hypothetical protein
MDETSLRILIGFVSVLFILVPVRLGWISFDLPEE